MFERGDTRFKIMTTSCTNNAAHAAKVDGENTIPTQLEKDGSALPSQPFIFRNPVVHNSRILHSASYLDEVDYENFVPTIISFITNIACQMRRLFLVCIAVLVMAFGSSFVLDAQPIQDKVVKLSKSSNLRNGKLAVYAINVTTKETVASLNEDLRMTPASNLKLLTTYAAVDILGANHRFETVVETRGAIQDGRLIGDVLVRASGDPTLGSKFFNDGYPSESEVLQRIAGALKDQGISVIEGRILVDGSIYSGPDIAKGYSWEDIGNYYAAGATALTFRDNRFSAFLRSGSTPGQTVSLQRLEPASAAEVKCETKCASISSDQAYFYLDGQEMTLRGQIPLNKSNFEVKGALPDPEGYFVQSLKTRLSENGIEVGDALFKPTSGTIELHRFVSPPLIQIIGHTNMRSDNLFADHLLRQIGVSRKGEGSFDAGIEELKKWMLEKEIPAEGLKMKGGSGLSASDRVTAQMMCVAMLRLREEHYYRHVGEGDGFMHSLPVAGESGSMRRVGKGTAIAGKMRAKTGYINGVRAYTGAVVNGAGEVVVFSVIANDYSCSASEMRKRLAELLVVLGS